MTRGRTLLVCAPWALLAVALWTACSSTGSGGKIPTSAGGSGSSEALLGGAESLAGQGNAPAAAGGSQSPTESPAEDGGARSSEGGAPSTGNAGGQSAIDPSPAGSGGIGETAGGSGNGNSNGTLIDNGDFSAGMQGWEVMMNGGAVTVRSDAGRLCVEAGAAPSEVIVGWPYAPYVPITLEPGVPYTFSFRAVGTRTIQIAAKLGLVTSSFTPYAFQLVETSGTWQTFSTSFTLNSGSQSIGVAISFTLAALDSVCLDDVIVTTP